MAEKCIEGLSNDTVTIRINGVPFPLGSYGVIVEDDYITFRNGRGVTGYSIPFPIDRIQPNTVEGYIVAGVSNDTVFVSGYSLDNYGDGKSLKDTVLLQNGRLKYTFPNDGAYVLYFSFAQLFVHNRPSGGTFERSNASLIVLAVPEDKIFFAGNLYPVGLGGVIVIGSDINRYFSEIQRRVFEMRKNEVEEEFALEQAMMEDNKEMFNIGLEKRRIRNNAIQNLYLEYIKSNLDDPLSAYLLSSWPHHDYVLMYHDKLGGNARNSVFRNMLDAAMKRSLDYKNYLKAKEEIVVGSKAPDFTLEDTNGKQITLSSLRGKYVILDFWGSWCGPCIMGIPKMKDAYEKYKNKIEILGVACKESSTDIWRNTVEKHELPWMNVIDRSFAVNVKYAVDAYPTKIVIDPEGTILIYERGEGEDFYLKLDDVIEL